MIKLDSFFDTYEKRNRFVYLIFLLCCLMMAVPHLFLGIQVSQVQNYEQTLSLLDSKLFSICLLGRCALQLLNMQVLNIMTILWNILISLKLYEIIFLVGSILYLFTHEKKKVFVGVISFGLSILVIFINFVLGFAAGSFLEVIGYIRIIGISFILIYGIYLIFILFLMVQVFKEYLEALKVEVIVVEE